MHFGRMADIGNPNEFKTFKSRHALVVALPHTCSNNTLMLTCTNVVEMLGDFTITDYVAESEIFKAPSECIPTKNLAIPVCYQGIDGYKITTLIIDTTGSGFLVDSIPDTFFLMSSGINYNISNNFYQEVPIP